MAQQHNSEFVLPQELCVKPLCLVGLTGLDTLNNAVHKSIWEAFYSNRRIERAPVNFKLLCSAHEFPVIKPKRNSYEWYIPKGILKRNWMNKHLNEIPAVIVIFYDLDWNDPQWNEKMIECSSRVQSIRAAIEGRNTRITVVLIQQTLPLPASEDVLAAERAAALCGSCELNSKSLFVLPLGDHLQGYIVRLESAFYDLAQNYYHYEARNIKSHRDHLNKTTHQYLFVRHQFKMGFLNELKQDRNTALKHYSHAYSNLSEIRIVDTNALEIKTVAGFINYKLCRIMFNLGQPRDAIQQFRNHIDRFKTRIGFRELTFEHHAWLANEYSIFGEIFDEAVKLGLPALQTQHPGFYFQHAAQQAILRKKSCEECCKDITEYPSSDPLEGIERMEFYGQRPWRPGKLSAEPPDPHKEQSGIQALQLLETQVNHSSFIISYYGQAISQFKTYKCPRMRRYLVVQMAEEYYNSFDYGKALTLFTHMLWDYRCEGWWKVITDILQKALKCAYLCANIQDYISLSLELLGASSSLENDEKIRIYNNLSAVLKKISPEPEPNLPLTETQKATDLWKNVIISDVNNTISLDMNNITSCIESKARFTQSKFEVDSQVTVEVFIRSTCPMELNFTHLKVMVNSPNYSSEFAVMDGCDGNPGLTFQSGEIKRFLVEFVPDIQDIGQEIQIGCILLHLGTKISTILRFNGTSNNTPPCELTHFRLTSNVLDFDNIRPLATATIVPRLSKVQVEVLHDQPALIGEWYNVDVDIKNAENLDVERVELSVGMDIDEIGPELQTEFNSKAESNPTRSPLIIKIPNLKVSETTKATFFMHSRRGGDRNVTLRLSYYFGSEKQIESVKEINVNIPVTKPFDILTKYFSKRFEGISNFFVKEPFVVMPQVRCTSPWPIVIENSSLELNPLIKGQDHQSQLSKIKLQSEEMGAEIFVCETDKKSDVQIQIGTYTIFWHRENSSNIINKTQITLTGLAVDEIPLFVDTILPAFGYVRTPMAVEFHMFNRSKELLQFELSMEISEAFMFAGYKQIQISILPQSVKTIKYNLYPLVPGNVILPKLKLTVDETEENCKIKQDQINLLLERCIPSYVYIMPQSKKSPVKTNQVKEATPVQ